MNVQYTAGKNIPLTDYLSRHPIAHEHEAEAPRENEEREAEEEFVINQIYGLFEFNRANGSITQHIRRPSSATNSDQSQNRKRTRDRTNNRNSIQTLHRETTVNRQTAQTLKAKYRKCQKWIKSMELTSNSSSENGNSPQKQTNLAPREIKIFNQTTLE